jgi:hypothetical protein
MLVLFVYHFHLLLTSPKLTGKARLLFLVPLGYPGKAGFAEEVKA